MCNVSDHNIFTAYVWHIPWIQDLFPAPEPINAYAVDHILEMAVHLLS
jgi:hypothetical protein